MRLHPKEAKAFISSTIRFKSFDLAGPKSDGTLQKPQPGGMFSGQLKRVFKGPVLHFSQFLHVWFKPIFVR